MKTYTATTPLADDRDVLELIAESQYGHQAEWVLVPIELLPADFFQLRSGVAGAMVQKFVQYSVKVAFVGDISAYVEASTAFRDWVREANRGGSIRFEADQDALPGGR